jgi:hypothetical protein
MIVGASIVITLIGRSELPDHIPGSEDRAKVFKDESPEEKLAEHEAAAAEKKKQKARGDDRGTKA